MTDFVYRLKKLEGDADKYGNCEVCDSPADRTYLLTAQTPYIKSTGVQSLSHCFSKFGHKSCLSKLTEVPSPVLKNRAQRA